METEYISIYVHIDTIGVLASVQIKSKLIPKNLFDFSITERILFIHCSPFEWVIWIHAEEMNKTLFLFSSLPVIQSVRRWSNIC